jgi:hypothetical protein
MASENAIVPIESKGTLVSTASQEFLSKPATPPISGITSDDLCDRCSRFDFGELNSSSESLDIYLYTRSENCSGPKSTLHGNCPLCKLLEKEAMYGTSYRYEHNAVIHESGSSGRVVFFLRAAFGGKLVYVHKLPAEGSLPCAISLDIGRANMCLASKWVRLCYQRHEGLCGEKLEHVVPGLKVIDCISRKICVATHGNPYVALSYVWGSPLPDSHELPGEALQTFPQTIEDAIVVAKKLEIPYLWVDRYCIDQNIQKEKHTMISNMDKIYSGAELTIIAAAGSDPQHGLPGVSTTVRHGTSIDTFSHGTLLSWSIDPSDIERSHWATRGWTYQEMLLSRRRLVFTDSQMLFQCCSGEFQELFNITAPSDPIPNVSKLACPDMSGVSYSPYNVGDTFPQNGIGGSASEIYSRIHEYTERKLSYPGDVLNAFNGIFSAFDRSMQGFGSHFWGIPIWSTCSGSELYQWTQSFVAGLTWYVAKPCDRRPGLWPSWSWTTVMGKVVQFRWAILELEFRLQNPLTYTFTHKPGAKESISDFVRGKRDYTEYDQCVDATTWVLQDCEIMTQQRPDVPLLGYTSFETSPRVLLGHPSFGTEISFVIYLDVNISEEQLSPAYVAVFLRATELKSFFLVAQEIEDGCLRRVGLVRIWHTLEVSEDSERTEELTWLPGKEPRNSFNEWEWKTVRLV